MSVRLLEVRWRLDWAGGSFSRFLMGRGLVPCHMGLSVGLFRCDMASPKSDETVADFIFLGSKITADGDCSHEIKRCLLLGRKVITQPR